MKEDPTPYIKESTEKITNPAVCVESGTELDLTNGALVYLTEEYRPLLDAHKDKASYIASVHHGGGFPWNGIHPETGETSALQSTEWWNLKDIKPI